MMFTLSKIFKAVTLIIFYRCVLPSNSRCFMHHFMRILPPKKRNTFGVFGNSGTATETKSFGCFEKWFGCTAEKKKKKRKQNSAVVRLI